MIVMDKVLADDIQEFIISLGITPYSNVDDVCFWVEESCGKFAKFNTTRVRDGASKICLLFEGVNFVVKWSTEGYNEAMQEVRFYNEAKAKNLAKFFPQTEFFFSYGGIEYVVQERIAMSAGELSWDGKAREPYVKIAKTVTPKMVRLVGKELNKVSSYSRSIDGLWISCCLSLYGKRAVKSLCQFVQEHDINDLHGSNVGYSREGKPIILDFSGYHREDY